MRPLAVRPVIRLTAAAELRLGMALRQAPDSLRSTQHTASGTCKTTQQRKICEKIAACRLDGKTRASRSLSFKVFSSIGDVTPQKSGGSKLVIK
jgi:hypothetical protein